MARKRSKFGVVLALGGAAAAGYMIYKNRDLIRSFLEELTAPVEEPDYEGTVIEFDPAPVNGTPAESEADIVIDRTADMPEASVEEG